MTDQMVRIDEDVCDTLGKSREELEALSIGDMIELVLVHGYDIEITLRHSFDHGHLRFLMGDPIQR